MRNLTASDRSALIRLAASLPKNSEGRRTILSGLSKVSDEMIPLKKGDLQKVFDEVGIKLKEPSGFPFKEKTKELISVPVPPMFSSLFKELSVSCYMQNPSVCQIEWKYEHPGGGRNGYSIGVLFGTADGLGFRPEGKQYSIIGN